MDSKHQRLHLPVPQHQHQHQHQRLHLPVPPPFAVMSLTLGRRDPCRLPCARRTCGPQSFSSHCSSGVQCHGHRGSPGLASLPPHSHSWRHWGPNHCEHVQGSSALVYRPHPGETRAKDSRNLRNIELKLAWPCLVVSHTCDIIEHSGFKKNRLPIPAEKQGLSRIAPQK